MGDGLNQVLAWSIRAKKPSHHGLDLVSAALYNQSLRIKRPTL